MCCETEKEACQSPGYPGVGPTLWIQTLNLRTACPEQVLQVVPPTDKGDLHLLVFICTSCHEEKQQETQAEGA